eukprot:sb/3476877/
MIKTSVANCDLHIVESGCSCKIATRTLRISLCNAHDESSTLGATMVLQGADITQYVRLPVEEGDWEGSEERSNWLQVGLFSLPPVLIDVNKRVADPTHYKKEQRAFLKMHDQR